MTQTTNRFFDELGKLMTDAAGAAQGAQREMETFMRAQAEKMLAGMDLVRRDEFEAVKAMAAKTFWPKSIHGSVPSRGGSPPDRACPQRCCHYQHEPASGVPRKPHFMRNPPFLFVSARHSSWTSPRRCCDS
jgi:hypothetical protein